MKYMHGDLAFSSGVRGLVLPLPWSVGPPLVEGPGFSLGLACAPWLPEPFPVRPVEPLPVLFGLVFVSLVLPSPLVPGIAVLLPCGPRFKSSLTD